MICYSEREKRSNNVTSSNFSILWRHVLEGRRSKSEKDGEGRRYEINHFPLNCNGLFTLVSGKGFVLHFLLSIIPLLFCIKSCNIWGCHSQSSTSSHVSFTPRTEIDKFTVASLFGNEENSVISPTQGSWDQRLAQTWIMPYFVKHLNLVQIRRLSYR